MQIETTMRYHLLPVRTAVTENMREMMARLWRKGNPCAPLVGMYIGVTTVRDSMEIPQKIENRTRI